MTRNMLFASRITFETCILLNQKQNCSAQILHNDDFIAVSEVEDYCSWRCSYQSRHIRCHGPLSGD